MPLKIEIIANDEAELTAMVSALSRLLPRGVQLSEPKVTVNKPDVAKARASVSIEPMDMGDEADASAGDDEQQDDSAEQAEAKRGRGRPKGSTNKPKAEPVPSAEPAKDEPAADIKAMRTEAINWATEVFARGAAGAAAVRAVSAKFSVKKLIDVPDDQVPILHAEAFKLKETIQ